jgi:hypothetical protein
MSGCIDDVFLTSELAGGVWSSVSPRWGKSLRYPLDWRFGGPTAGVDDSER